MNCYNCNHICSIILNTDNMRCNNCNMVFYIDKNKVESIVIIKNDYHIHYDYAGLPINNFKNNTLRVSKLPTSLNSLFKLSLLFKLNVQDNFMFELLQLNISDFENKIKLYQVFS